MTSQHTERKTPLAPSTADGPRPALIPTRGDSADWTSVVFPGPSAVRLGEAKRARAAAQRRPKKGRATGPSRGSTPLMPPPLNVTPVFHRRLRFRNSATTLKTVNVNHILGALGAIVTVANSTAVTFCSAFKLRSITIWPGVGSPTFAQVSWNPTSGTGQAKEKQIIESTPTGITSEPGPMVFSVPRASNENVIAAQWLNALATGTNVFDIQASSGSIVDVSIDFQIANEVAGLLVTGLGTVALGSVGYLPLDGTGGIYSPLGMPVIA